jgi:hypothetical protein
VKGKGLGKACFRKLLKKPARSSGKFMFVAVMRRLENQKIPKKIAQLGRSRDPPATQKNNTPK